MDSELKELLEKAKAAIGNAKQVEDQLNQLRAWGEEKGRLAEAEKAIGEVKELAKELQENFEKKMDAMRRQVYDAAGNYHGRAFRSEDEARAFGLNVLRSTAEHRSRAAEMLEADHKEFYDQVRAGHAGEDSLVGHSHFRRIQRLVEEYGLFPRLAFEMPMPEAGGTFHRRTTGLRARKTKVRARVPEQTLGFEPINLSADSYDILVSYPIELDDDALIVFAEVIAEEMALGFAIALDEDGFVGDGTDLFDNVLGITTRLVNLNGVDDGGGIKLAAGAAGAGWGGVTHDDVLELIGRARYVRPGQGRIICSNEFYWSVLAKLIKAANGRTAMETESGTKLMFEGTQVEITAVMPRVSGHSQIPMLYGDVYLSSTLGNRREMTIRESREVRFETKEVVMLASSRYDINNHTLGDAIVPGPVVGLMTPPAA